MPAHARERTARRPTGRATRWIVAAIVMVLLALVAGVAVLATRKPPAATAVAFTHKVLPLAVVGTTPVPGAAAVPSSTTVSVSFSVPLAADSAMPTFTPPLTGTWAALSPSVLEFTDAGPLVPGSAETLTVPAGPTGMRGSQNQHLAQPYQANFTVAAGSTLRLQQLLALLGYLPLTFTPATQPTDPQQEADPQAGQFTWRWADQPASLTSLWTEGSNNVITRGAVMAFESQHGLTTDGLPGPMVWSDLLQAAGTGVGDTAPYSYVSVSESLPESLEVYQNGAPVYGSVVNTGVAAAATDVGTFPVYLRYRVTTMSGKNPDGSHYSDPGIPWVSYFSGGDALHGYIRSSYGFPQSDGCVEMPFANAAQVWPLTPIGTLVTVA